MSMLEQAVRRLEDCGSSGADRGAVFARLIVDADLHREIAGMSSNDREAAFMAISAALRKAGKMAALREAVAAAMRERLQSGGTGRAGRVFGLPLPPGYRLDEDGAVLQTIVNAEGRAQEILVCRREMAVTALIQDRDLERVFVEVTWRTRAGRAESVVIPRTAMADSRGIVAATAEAGTEGAPVHSRNAGAVVEYLAAQEDRAGKDLPRAILARRMGWVDGPDGKPAGFLAGRQIIRGRRVVDIDEDGAEVRVVMDKSIGMTSLADRVKQGGTMEGWRMAIAPVLAFPVLGLCLCAAIAPVLLRVIETTPSAGILDIAGSQGTGKTSAVEIGAASVWGPGSLRVGPIVDCNGSEAGLKEHRLAVGGLPLLLNETQHLRRYPELLAALPFEIFEGQIKILSNGAGSTRGLQTARSGAIFTGNSALIDMAEETEGVRSRVLTCTSLPWGPRRRETAALMLEAQSGVLEHYGHMGPAFASLIDERRDWWSELRRRHAERSRHWAEQLDGNGGERAGKVLALYEIAGSIARLSLGLSTLQVDVVMAEALQAARTSLGDADIGMRALRVVVSWAQANEQRLDGRVSAPVGGTWIGQWLKAPASPLVLLQEPMCSLLRARRIPVEDTLKDWSRRGWLDGETIGGKPRRTRRVTVGSVRGPCYVLTPGALAAVGAGQGPDGGNELGLTA